MKRRGVYPFTAIVGQEDMKLSLILNVINPALGGVLIKGEKGTAKSTAVRALAELLPAMEAVKGWSMLTMCLYISAKVVRRLYSCTKLFWYSPDREQLK